LAKEGKAFGDFMLSRMELVDALLYKRPEE
jgi:hypothetical protein